MIEITNLFNSVRPMKCVGGYRVSSVPFPDLYHPNHLSLWGSISGLTSAGAIRLTSLLEERLKVALPATLVFDYPSVAAIVEFLHSEGLSPAAELPTSLIAPPQAPPLPGPLTGPPSPYLLVPSAPTPLRLSPMIAITAECHSNPSGPPVGLEGGQVKASTPASHRGTGLGGIVDTSSVPPLSRWDVESDTTEAAVLAGDGLPARFGSFLAGAEEFDAGSFGLSRAEAVLMGEMGLARLSGLYDLEFSVHLG